MPPLGRLIVPFRYVRDEGSRGVDGATAIDQPADDGVLPNERGNLP
jgi:hypothetical protein